MIYPAPLMTTLYALAVTTASGAPIEMAIDPGRSSIELTMTVDVGFASDSDSVASPLSGELSIELDDAGSPASLVLDDTMIVIDQTLKFYWSFGFIGQADATLTGAGVSYATPGLPTPPAPIIAGSFQVPDVPLAFMGEMDVSYTILGSGGGESVDLGDQDPFITEFTGQIESAGGMLTLMSSVPVESSVPLTDGSGAVLGTVTISGVATLLATGAAPQCPADLTGDGGLDFFDVSAFLSAFAAMDSLADLDGDGSYTFFDVSAFLVAFNAGCS